MRDSLPHEWNSNNYNQCIKNEPEHYLVCHLFSIAAKINYHKFNSNTICYLTISLGWSEVQVSSAEFFVQDFTRLKWSVLQPIASY